MVSSPRVITRYRVGRHTLRHYRAFFARFARWILEIMPRHIRRIYVITPLFIVRASQRHVRYACREDIPIALKRRRRLRYGAGLLDVTLGFAITITVTMCEGIRHAMKAGRVVLA